MIVRELQLSGHGSVVPSLSQDNQQVGEHNELPYVSKNHKGNFEHTNHQRLSIGWLGRDEVLVVSM